MLAQLRVESAHGDAGVGFAELVEGEGGGDDGGEARGGAVVRDLEELLDGPGRAGVGTEVVEDEESGVADALEQLVVARVSAVGGEGGAEVVEEVGTTAKKASPPLRRRAFATAAARCVLPQPLSPRMSIQPSGASAKRWALSQAVWRDSFSWEA